MKTLIIFLLLLVSAIAQKPVQLSEEARRKIIEQMAELANDQQVQLNDALQSEREVQSQLVRATNELVDAGTKIASLQKAIEVQTNELNKAIAAREEWEKKYDVAQDKLNWWRWVAAGISTLGLLYAFGPMLLRFFKPI